MPTRVLVKVTIAPGYRNKLDHEDHEVAGTYEVDVDDSVPTVYTSSAALDGFHNNVPVALLEAFEFRVTNKLGADLSDQLGGKEGEFAELATVQGKLPSAPHQQTRFSGAKP